MIASKFIITAQELKSKIDSKENIQIIDVREKFAYENPIKNSDWIPASKILISIKQIKTDIPVILYCRTGVDSFCLANILHMEYNFTNIYNLKAGIEAFRNLNK